MDSIPAKPIGHKVIVAYHSLPLSTKKLKLGVWSFYDRNLSSLVSSITSLKDQNVISDHCWVGCPTIDYTLLSGETKQDRDALSIQLLENSCVAVDKVSPQLYEDACVKFSKKFLKPLFHYDISNSIFHDGHWKSYKEFNRIFARKIASIYKPGDIIWIHGLQLLLLPKYLRELRPNIMIGFYLHCPFPAVEVFRCLASRKKILQGILGSDLIAFQSYSYLRYFIQSCTRILGSHAGYDGVRYKNEKIGKEQLSRVSVYPEGIDPSETQRSLMFPQVQKRIQELKEQYKDKQILFAKDQAEAIEATKMKLIAFERFLRSYPEWIGKVVFILICEPSKGSSRIISMVNETVARINGEFSRVGFIPIEYITRPIDYEELCTLYYVADVFVSTPLREGQSLDTHEYVACHRDNPGILILSEFDGASRCFGGAICVNSWSAQQISASYHQALTLSAEEASIKHDHNLNYVLTNTSFLWGQAILYDLFSCRDLIYNGDHLKDSSLLDILSLDQSYRLAKKRLLFFDYDGTFTNTTKNEKVLNKFLKVFKRLSSDPLNTVYIVTSRDIDTIETLLEDIPSLGLGSEHGNFLKASTGIPGSDEWKYMSEGVDTSWMSIVEPILEYFTERTPGSKLDFKKVTVSWNYQDATGGVDFADNQAQELLTQLLEVGSKSPIDIIHSNRTIEIKPSGTGSGTAMQRILEEDHDLDFILVVGDVNTDQKMFELLDPNNQNHFSISIGKIESFAKYYINTQNQLLKILDHISSPINHSNVSPIPFIPLNIDNNSPSS